MKVTHKDEALARVEKDSGFDGGMPSGVVTSFRRRMQAIRAAVDERDLAAVRGNRFERLKGNRSHQYSIRLNDQFRLILELEGSGSGKTVVVVGVEDYH